MRVIRWCRVWRRWEDTVPRLERAFRGKENLLDTAERTHLGIGRTSAHHLAALSAGRQVGALRKPLDMSSDRACTRPGSCSGNGGQIVRAGTCRSTWQGELAGTSGRASGGLRRLG